MKGFWGCPSGFIESGESAEDACLRELEEEAGVTGEIQRLVRVMRREDAEVYGDMLVVSYLVKITGGVPEAGNEVEEVRYDRPDELPDYLSTLLQDIVTEINPHS